MAHFLKVGKQFKHLSVDQLLALGIRPEMIPYIQLDYLQQQSVLARFDFICTEEGYIKCLELNGETPFLVQETFEMNDALCQHFGYKNPNDVTALQKHCRVLFCCHPIFTRCQQTKDCYHRENSEGGLRGVLPSTVYQTLYSF